MESRKGEATDLKWTTTAIETLLAERRDYLGRFTIVAG
jgi:hypothetical protein